MPLCQIEGFNNKTKLNKMKKREVKSHLQLPAGLRKWTPGLSEWPCNHTSAKPGEARVHGYVLPKPASGLHFQTAQHKLIVIIFVSALLKQKCHLGKKFLKHSQPQRTFGWHNSQIHQSSVGMLLGGSLQTPSASQQEWPSRASAVWIWTDEIQILLH